MKRIAFVCAYTVLLAWLGARQARGEGLPAAITRSPLYAVLPKPVRFRHSAAAHRAMPCTACHRARLVRAGSPEDHRPNEAACTACHAELTDRRRSDAAHCGFCHRDFDPQRTAAPELLPLRAARVRFDHPRHAAIACAGCHTSEQGTSEPAFPSMATCRGCHTASRELACNGCHVTTPSGRLQTAFGSDTLVPRGALFGMAHDSDFAIRHRWIAADHGAVCASCHVESECSGCHDGTRKPRGIHPNDYLALHAQDVQRNATRCTSCHSQTSFCLACHARLGIAQLSSPDISSPRRFHPPSSQWIRGSVLHAREAQRSLGTCVSCHEERDCIVCHGAGGFGIGLHSPHPVGFAASCAGAFARSARACLMCHRASDAALQACR